ncbi:MAG TPA: periplasmic heavy metal sensor [Pyrinomonadaceae bacterium]|jgi:Spy/CpxP family protein refolding chaperone|nr:periplasmic heavy metal sensor [Pyrinomonadaceae bacterium]
MRQAALLLSLTFIIALSTFAQVGSPQGYAGQQKRETKALSAEEIQSLLDGEGMGLAKAAELNHYPGPKHVLDLAAKLDLSEKQAARAREIFGRMHTEAVRLGRLIVGKERELDELFAKSEINSGKLQSVSREIALLQGSLRAAHLQAHIETKSILTPAQIKKYDELRGYDAPGVRGTHQHHGHGEH